jgi:hypothetical protein
MSHTPYVPIYNYAAKDSLPSGNTNKVIRGSELTEEFNAISKDLIRADARGRLFASCTYNGEDIVTSFGVEKVEWINQEINGEKYWYFAKITFLELLPKVTEAPSSGANGDINAVANVQVTAFANKAVNTAFVCPTVVDLEEGFVVVGFYQLGQPEGVQAVVWPTGFCLAVFQDAVPE